MRASVEVINNAAYHLKYESTNSTMLDMPASLNVIFTQSCGSRRALSRREMPHTEATECDNATQTIRLHA